MILMAAASVLRGAQEWKCRLAFVNRDHDSDCDGVCVSCIALAFGMPYRIL